MGPETSRVESLALMVVLASHSTLIIQLIATLSKYGHVAVHICNRCMTDILPYTKVGILRAKWILEKCFFLPYLKFLLTTRNFIIILTLTPFSCEQSRLR